MEDEKQGGCPIHGPFHVCGHIAENCPDKKEEEAGGDVLDDRPDFQDFVPLNRDMTPAEALEWLYKYFPKTKPGVLEREFSDLSSAVGAVNFKKPILERHRGSIVLRGTKPDGSPWYYLLGTGSGIKQAKIG